MFFSSPHAGSRWPKKKTGLGTNSELKAAALYTLYSAWPCDWYMVQREDF